jgi:methyltransferase family protein
VSASSIDPQDAYDRGFGFGRQLAHREEPPSEPLPANPLADYFDGHTTGPGLWKWRHYFDVYHRHFQRFVGREVHVVEIGVFSGGSLGMWREYFGAGCRIYGVDLQPECRAYEEGPIRIFIGDQGDPEFWRGFRREVPAVDVVIDDGGHDPLQQIVTLEALLPHIRRGGVYLCEDVHGPGHPFHNYVNGLSRNLHSMGHGDAPFARRPIDFQRTIESIHLYPYLTVIEKRSTPLEELSAPQHGTEWQPFLGGTPSG